MKRLYVFADFDWLKEPRLIGELSYESLRGSDSYGFCYRTPLKSLKSKRNRNNEGREPYCCLQPITVVSHAKNVDVAKKNNAQSKFYNKMLPF